MRVAVLVVLAGCGRVGFDARGDAAGPDTAVEPELIRLSCDAIGSTGMTDLSGHGNDAHCAPTCPTLVPGVHGNACSFDGTQELDIASPLMGQAFAIATWIQFATDPPMTVCAVNRALGTATIDSWQLCISPGPEVDFLTEQGAQFGGISAGSWHHAVVEADGTSKYVYVDGQLRSQNVASLVHYDGNPITIGRDLDNGAPYAAFTGLLDDIYVYDRMLTPAELATLATP